MIWFILASIIISIITFYALAWRFKLEYSKSEVFLKDLIDDCGPLLFFIIMPGVNVLVLLLAIVFIISLVAKDVKIL